MALEDQPNGGQLLWNGHHAVPGPVCAEAERGVAGGLMQLPLVGQCGSRPVPDELAFHLCQPTKQRENETPVRRTRVQRFGNAMQLDASGQEQVLDQGKQVPCPARETVEPPHDHVTHCALVASFEQLLESRPVKRLARPAFVCENISEPETLRFGVRSDAGALGGDAHSLTDLLVSANTHVAHRHATGVTRWPLHGCTRARMKSAAFCACAAATTTRRLSLRNRRSHPSM